MPAQKKGTLCTQLSKVALNQKSRATLTLNSHFVLQATKYAMGCRWPAGRDFETPGLVSYQSVDLTTRKQTRAWLGYSTCVQVGVWSALP